MHEIVDKVTARIAERSRDSRAAYLARIDKAAHGGPSRAQTSCSNLAHAMAAMAPIEKKAIAGRSVPNIGIVNSYNDMLSAHKPFEDYPDQIRRSDSCRRGEVRCGCTGCRRRTRHV